VLVAIGGLTAPEQPPGAEAAIVVIAGMAVAIELYVHHIGGPAPPGVVGRTPGGEPIRALGGAGSAGR